MIEPTSSQPHLLTPAQLEALLAVLRDGALEASRAWSRWVGRPTEVAVERVEQLALAEATDILGPADEQVGACLMALAGRLAGGLMLVFDDPSGWALADLLLEQPQGTACHWGDIEQSAVLETTNIVGCAFLNALSRRFQQLGETAELLPSPPRFTRDFAGTILQCALLNQAMASDTVFLSETAFHVDRMPANWNLLFVPDADSVPTLARMLT